MDSRWSEPQHNSKTAPGSPTSTSRRVCHRARGARGARDGPQASWQRPQRLQRWGRGRRGRGSEGAFSHAPLLSRARFGRQFRHIPPEMRRRVKTALSTGWRRSGCAFAEVMVVDELPAQLRTEVRGFENLCKLRYTINAPSRVLCSPVSGGQGGTERGAVHALLPLLCSPTRGGEPGETRSVLLACWRCGFETPLKKSKRFYGFSRSATPTRPDAK